ncbi:MAG TPA: ABC transporter ATP-binding protein [Bacteroidia bacterium]|nr:ABC transporter ATP-binding protein [Bacteroidia bacterium]HNP98343.1 ABC transporter ATP-binding protein [Bacteroidia bacterium]
METLLEINNLSTEFNSGGSTVNAVKNLSLTLSSGETVGIVGESGSGKSVTALSIMRLLSTNGKISSGEINYQSSEGQRRNILSLTEDQMRAIRGNEIAMIFQEPMTALNPVLSCGFQVAEAMVTHRKLTREEAMLKTVSLFEKVNLPQVKQMLEAYPHQLSGGQKQRVLIAMALSCDPRILIADEPTTSLDVTVQASILKLMKNLQKEKNMGMLFISHDLGVIGEVADRVVVMYKGKIVEEGTVQDIFTSPQHPYTKGLLACRPPLNNRPAKLKVISDFMKEEADGSVSTVHLQESDSNNESLATEEKRKLSHKAMYSLEPLLKVENLKTWFPVRGGIFSTIKDFKKAVDDVSFDVFPGETLGLVGESGCGKTTLGRSILRLIEPNEGELYFENKNLISLEGKELRKMRKRMQIIFQDPYASLNPRMTVGEAILEPMTVHGLYTDENTRKKKVVELLERVSLKPEHAKRYPYEFSGGQRQRICIARALASEPDFIICDECVSALDVSIQAQVLNLLNDLKRDFGFTSIFISHDLSVVKYMSDRMMVMHNGKIIETGDPDEIYAFPKSEYTRNLIASIPLGFPGKVNSK